MLSSWQTYLHLTLISPEVSNRPVSYYKPAASLINNFRNTHTQNTYIQSHVPFKTIRPFHMKWAREPQELTLQQKAGSQKRILSFKEAFPYTVVDNMFQIRSLNDIMPLWCHDQHTLTFAQYLVSLWSVLPMPHTAPSPLQPKRTRSNYFYLLVDKVLQRHHF